MLSFIGLVFLGLIIGIFAKKKYFNKDNNSSLLLTILLGIIGTFLGNILRTSLGGDSFGTFNPINFWDWLYSIGGAILLIFSWNKLIKPNLK